MGNADAGADENERRRFDIAELAALAGLQPSALRHYEREGLLTPSGRVGGRRVYDNDGLRQLAAIDFWQEAGFTLAEIARLLNHADGSLNEAKTVAADRIAEIEALVAEALQVKDFLTHVLLCVHEELTECSEYNAHLTERAQRISSGEAPRRQRARPLGLRPFGRHSTPRDASSDHPR
ncbi:MerR family transcriptional regulator [Spirillospora sp. NBC_00431]